MFTLQKTVSLINAERDLKARYKRFCISTVTYEYSRVGLKFIFKKITVHTHKYYVSRRFPLPPELHMGMEED